MAKMALDGSLLDDLDFADDGSPVAVQDKTTRLDEEVRRIALKINIEKITAMRNQGKITVINGRDASEDVDEITFPRQSLYGRRWYEGPGYRKPEAHSTN